MVLSRRTLPRLAILGLLSLVALLGARNRAQATHFVLDIRVAGEPVAGQEILLDSLVVPLGESGISWTELGRGILEDLSFSWNFGDGSTGEGEYLTHVYSEPGVYLVTLEAHDRDGDTQQVQRAITVAETSAPVT